MTRPCLLAHVLVDFDDLWSRSGFFVRLAGHMAFGHEEDQKKIVWQGPLALSLLILLRSGRHVALECTMYFLRRVWSIIDDLSFCFLPMKSSKSTPS